MAAGLITLISNLFSGRSYSRINDSQERALVDALVFAMAADHDVSAVERDALVQALKVLKWEQSTSLESYVSDAIERAQQKVAREEDVAAYCADISQRLEEDWLREETYYLSARITAADQDISQDEQAYLREMVKAFEIDDAVQARITNQLIRETQF